MRTDILMPAFSEVSHNKYVFACALSHRNAARARIKDATGKAQRAHFGRKRFEILRTGLSRSGGVVANATRCSLGGPPDIALAHARQDRGAPEAEPVEEYHAGMRSASPRPSTPHRSRWLSSARGSMSRRSNVLRALDGEDGEFEFHEHRGDVECHSIWSAAAQRTQVDEILQVPDLLGLSKAGRKGWQHSLYAEMQVPSTPVRRRTPSIDKVYATAAYTLARLNSPYRFILLADLMSRRRTKIQFPLAQYQ